MIEKSNLIVVTCPSCGHRMKAKKGLLGKTAECVRCSTKFQVTPSNSQPFRQKSSASTSPSTQSRRVSLQELLLEKQLVTPEQLADAENQASEQGIPVYKVLIDNGILSKEDFSSLLSHHAHVAPIDLKNMVIEEDAVATISREFALQRLALPIAKLGRMLTLAMACPLDQDTIEAVHQLTGARVSVVLCDIDDIIATINRFLPPPQEEVEPETPELPEEETEPKSAQEVETPAPSEPEVSMQPTEPVPDTQEPGTPEKETVSPSAVPEWDREELQRLRDQTTTLIANTELLPFTSECLKRIQEASEEPDYPLKNLAVVCRADPAMTARLLSITNSPAYGIQDKVENANMAIILLGLKGVIQLGSLGASLSPVPPETGFDQNRFLRRSRFAAAAAEALAATAGDISLSQAFSAGLLHKIGWLALAYILPEKYASLDNSQDDQARIREEQRIFGLDHVEAGFMLLSNWKIPPFITQAMRYHCMPDRVVDNGPLACIVFLAARMAQEAEQHPDGEMPEFPPEILKTANLKELDILEIYQKTTALFYQ